jgi:hypothetical protein
MGCRGGEPLVAAAMGGAVEGDVRGGPGAPLDTLATGARVNGRRRPS